MASSVGQEQRTRGSGHLTVAFLYAALGTILFYGAGCGQYGGKWGAIYQRGARDPGELWLVARTGDDTVMVKVYYRPENVVLCDSMWTCANAAQYEETYDFHWADVDRVLNHVTLGRAGSAKLARMGFEEGVQGKGFVGLQGDAIGKLGGVMYVGIHKGGNWMRARSLLRQIVSEGGTLGIAYVPRIRVDQFMQGRWTPLSRYTGGLQAFCMAPEDTIRLRVYVRALEARYLRDGVTIAAMPRSEERTLQARVTSPNLTLPWWKLDRTERTIGVGDGSYREWTFARSKFFSHCEISVTISKREGCEQSAPAVQTTYEERFALIGPVVGGMYPDAKLLAVWPQVPTPQDAVAGVTHDGEFPGAGEYPRWAFERLSNWGLVYWKPELGSPEYRAHGPGPYYLKALQQGRDDLEAREGRAAADSFWLRVMDFEGAPGHILVGHKAYEP